MPTFRLTISAIIGKPCDELNFDLNAAYEASLLFDEDVIKISNYLIDEKFIPFLLNLFKNFNSAIRYKAREALVKIGPQAATALIGALRDRNKDVRFGAIKVLDQIGNESVVAALILALKDPRGEIRSLAIQALAKIGAESAVSAIKSAFKDRSKDVREQAVIALSKTKAELAVPALIETLKDPHVSPHVKQMAVMFLAKIGDKSEVSAFIDALQDQDKDVKRRQPGP